MITEKRRPKTPNRVDTYVGSRVRQQRKTLGLSQEKLGETLGITFQQVQKYEKGINRIGASRLAHIAACLNVPISYFFPGFEADSPLLNRSVESIDGTARLGVTPEAMELVQFFAEITDPGLRRNIVSLVRVLSEQHQALNAKS